MEDKRLGSGSRKYRISSPHSAPDDAIESVSDTCHHQDLIFYMSIYYYRGVITNIYLYATALKSRGRRRHSTGRQRLAIERRAGYIPAALVLVLA